MLSYQASCLETDEWALHLVITALAGHLADPLVEVGRVTRDIETRVVLVAGCSLGSSEFGPFRCVGL